MLLRLAFVLLGVLCLDPLARAVVVQPIERRVAITIDDLPTTSVLGDDVAFAERTTTALVGALVRNRVPAIGFVNERKLQPRGTVDPRRVALLQQWIDAGLELGNHTFSHPDLHNTVVADFEREVLDGERVTKPLLAVKGKPLQFFRHPFLHTGRTLEIKTAFEAFLQRHGYRVAPVTVDNYDYLFAAAYDRISAKGEGQEQQRVADAYVTYMDAVVGFYEEQSLRIVGREVAQTLLLHASALNGATFDRLAASLRARGYHFIELNAALEDPAYKHRDDYIGAAGMTWLHRWALTDGMRGSTFDGEPTVPAWIEAAAR
ncbi:MAG: polysaccharide deacetylase family protein [Vicinamibacterales bacterium]